MHIPDLSLCTYGRGAKSPESWNVPLLAIGWVEDGWDYSLGNASELLIERVRRFRDETGVQYSWYTYRGIYGCTLCDSGPQKSNIEGSQINLLVPGEGCVYMAPGAIVHYMETHLYLPPKEFIDAILSCPFPTTQGYEHALISANGGEWPEYIAVDEGHERVRAMMKKWKSEQGAAPNPGHS